MAFWKQAVVCAVLLLAAFIGWVRYDPAAIVRLKGYGIESPLIAAIAPQAAGNGRDGASGRASGGAARYRSAALVVTRKVGHATLNSRVKAIGSGMAIRTATITPTDSGTVKTVDVKAGDHLDAGQVIATLDSQAQQIAADRARLTLKDAEKKLARYRELKSSAAVTPVQIADQESAVEADRLALKQAEYDLGKRSIRAPISGVIGIININVGDYVTSQTQIATIDDRSKILIDFQVPERFSGSIEVGADVVATASAFPGRTFSGRVSAIDNRIDPDSRTLRVRAELRNPNDLLRAGMSFLVTLKFPGDDYPAVDPLSVQWDSSGAYVWKVHDGKAERVAVRVVQRDPQNVLVEGKLVAGDQVVTQGVQVLRAGSPVRIAESAGEEDAPAIRAPAQKHGASNAGAENAPMRQASARRAASL